MTFDGPLGIQKLHSHTTSFTLGQLATKVQQAKPGFRYHIEKLIRNYFRVQNQMQRNQIIQFAVIAMSDRHCACNQSLMWQSWKWKKNNLFLQSSLMVACCFFRRSLCASSRSVHKKRLNKNCHGRPACNSCERFERDLSAILAEIPSVKAKLHQNSGSTTRFNLQVRWTLPPLKSTDHRMSTS